MSKKPPFNRKKVFQNTSDRSMIDENYFAIGIFNGCGILVDDDSHMRKLYNEVYLPIFDFFVNSYRNFNYIFFLGVFWERKFIKKYTEF